MKYLKLHLVRDAIAYAIITYVVVGLVVIIKVAIG